MDPLLALLTGSVAAVLKTLQGMSITRQTCRALLGESSFLFQNCLAQTVISLVGTVAKGPVSGMVESVPGSRRGLDRELRDLPSQQLADLTQLRFGERGG